MCDCIKKIPKDLENLGKMKEVASKKTRQEYIEGSAEILNTAFNLSGRNKTYSEIEYKVENRVRKYKLTILHNYCPWCGSRYDEPTKKQKIIQRLKGIFMGKVFKKSKGEQNG